MPFWKKKPKVDQSLTFKQRVADFWKWFPSVADEFYQTIEEGNCGDLQPQTTHAVHKMWERFAWVYGPGDDEKGGHSLTVSGEGIKARQFLAEYWLSQAPELDNWTFHSSRQPGMFESHLELDIGGIKFAFGGFWITPELDEERQVVHITAWHPGFEQAEESQKQTALFILLDEILGEYGTDQWLGAIETSDDRLADAIPGLELREYLHDLEIKHGWKKYPPTQTFSTYEC
ncbi:MAG: hypothetical protein AAF226_12615, partial [Verrucomicrobiota bacterium]